MKNVVVIRGAGDIATGVAHRLYRSGLRVIMLEVEKPMVIRRRVAFAQAIYDGSTEVEGVKAVNIKNINELHDCLNNGFVPVLVDPEYETRSYINAGVLVDAILAKKNTGTTMDMAPITIGVGPGFFAGRDVHAVVETNRGHDLGRVIMDGEAEKDTGIPGNICGYTYERVLRSPCRGKVLPEKEIGQTVKKDEVVCFVGDMPVKSKIDGVLRGMINSIYVPENMKIADIDPRGEVKNCFTISDKARAVAGGVLEAILNLTL